MTAILAVDGGQSGIRLRHSNEARVVEVDGVSRSTDAVTAVAHAVGRAWEAERFPSVDRVVLGLTTAPTRVEGTERLCTMIAAVTGAPEVWLADDTVTSHCGALSGGPGVSLVVGTGVACLAVPDGGAPRVFDGHGYLLGDDGGAFWIARRGLREVLRARDRGEQTGLTALAAARYGDLDELHVLLHDSASPVNDIAQFARDVLEAAERHPVAGTILDEAAGRLHGTALAAAACIDGPESPLALGGRMLETGSPLRSRLDALLAGDSAIASRSADADPVDGALLLGSGDSPGRYRDLVYLWNEGSAA